MPEWRVLCAGGVEPNICRGEFIVFMALKVSCSFCWVSFLLLLIFFLALCVIYALLFLTVCIILLYVQICYHNVQFVGMKKCFIMSVTFGIGPSDLSNLQYNIIHYPPTIPFVADTSLDY